MMDDVPEVDVPEPGDGGSPRRAFLLAVALAWVVVVGVAGWLLVRDPPGVPSPSLMLGIDDVAPLVEDRVPSGSGGRGLDGYAYWRFDVGEDGLLRVEAAWEDIELPELVPARSRPELSLEQRQAFDLATLEGEEAIAAWRAEVGHDAPLFVPRGTVVADRMVDCVRVVISADGTGPVDPVAVDDLAETVRDRIVAIPTNRTWCEEQVRG